MHVTLTCIQITYQPMYKDIVFCNRKGSKLIMQVMQQVVEAGLGHLPFTEKTVVTPTGRQYVGVDFAKKLCGVSIIRSGESMENALRACCKGIKIGKILVHRCNNGDNDSVCPMMSISHMQLGCLPLTQGVRQRRGRAHI